MLESSIGHVSDGFLDLADNVDTTLAGL